MRSSTEMPTLMDATDNGAGIEDDLRPRLFQLFQQGNRDLARREGGLGIGLSVVRRLVELHQGTVEARSEGPGQGSEFIVRLPLAPEVAPDSTPTSRPTPTLEPTPTPTPTPAPAPVAGSAAPAHARAASLRMLIVDDNRDAGETLMMLVETLGHQTRLAKDGAAA